VIALVGWVALLAALISAATIAVRGFLVSRMQEPDVRPLAAPVLGFLLSSVVAFAALELAILSHDFSIEYVANNTASTTPLIFLFASGWAALEGSILLWGLVLAGFTYLVWRRVDSGDGLGAAALGVMGLVAVFWFGLMVTVADPFAICTEVVVGRCVESSWIPLGSAVAPLEGLGPNPLLQNHIIMAIHPPMLYLGYVGLTVPFAYAIAALARGEQGRAWLDRTHRWSIIAWSFLTFGILLGGWWSYEVLGWGGYWAWDPVENAAFLPWLVATAFIHSAVVQRRRGMLQAWNFVLVIATFSLTILGTFLTRSGVIASVHSFTQSAVGPALLAFLGVVVVGSLALFAMRVHLVSSSPRLESLASREGVFLANNLLLTLFAFTVLIGTMYPLLVEALSGDQVSVGRPFFDRVTLPIAFALLLAMGVGPVTPYRVARAGVVWNRIRVPVNVALTVGAITVLIGVRSVPTVVVIVLAAFVISVISAHFVRQLGALRTAGRSAGPMTILRREPGFWGGQIAHIGVAMMAVGIAASTGLAVRQEVRLDVGQSAVVDDYCLVYEGTFVQTEPNRRVEGAEFTLLRADCSTEIRTMRPRVNVYPNSLQPVATPDVRSGLIEDVYLSLTSVAGSTVAVDVSVFPLMWMLWLGGAVTAGGGLWSIKERRKRADRRRDEELPGLVTARRGDGAGDD
jgi:cytochrome c-type biogenesis protein CcmF